MRYKIHHITRYKYTEPVSLCQNVAHLAPRVASYQQCDQTEMTIIPEPNVVENTLDYFGNPVTFLSLQEPHKELVVTVDHQVTVNPALPPAAESTPSWETIRSRLLVDTSQAWLEALEYRFASRYVPLDDPWAEYARVSFPAGQSILAGSVDLTRRIFSEFVYDPRATTTATPVAEVFKVRRGVCQDFAHVQIACLRSLGLACRYVSGYLSTLPPPGKPRLIGADATHAWVSVFCGEQGWVDLDPTNNQIPGTSHILLAWGRDFDDVSPLKGVILGGGPHEVTVSVDVEPIRT